MDDYSDQALKNQRHEAFCQRYSGSCFGNATKAYSEAGFKPRSIKAAQAESSRLLSKGIVYGRVVHLRRIRMKELAIDGTRLMEMRLKIVYSPDSSDGDKLTAMRDIEKALGLARPEKVEHSIPGAVITFVHGNIEAPPPQPTAIIYAPEPEAAPTPAPEPLKAVEPAPAALAPAAPARSGCSAEPVIDWSRMSRFGC